VLLVDADLPKPHVSRIFGLQKEPGLTDSLADDTLSVESLVISTTVPGLGILPAGHPIEGMSELLSSNRMRQVMRSLTTASARRIVLLDSPPLLVTTEARALLALTGQIALVVRAGQTSHKAVLDAVALIGSDVGGGLIVNDAPAGIFERYYGYDYGYGDGSSGRQSADDVPNT